jgi:predicted AlkP superfamily phosphohydrolase/phosphomutase
MLGHCTAHLQHMYWRSMEPEAFTLKPRAEEQAELANAILFGYQTMDRLVAEFRRLVGEDGTITFCIALSRAARCRTARDLSTP